MVEIKIIGPAASGKTTYLATLGIARHQDKLPGLTIRPTSEDAVSLQKMARNSIKDKKIVGQTRVSESGKEPIYQFEIKIPGTKRGRGSEIIYLTAVDYAGEIFENIAKPHMWHEVDPYIEELCKVQGWMVMITDWQPERDEYIYKPIFDKLWQEITRRQERKTALTNLKIAVVMSKCERGELWPGRFDAGEDLFKVRLPDSYESLTSNFPRQRLKFFACSSFGVLDERDPRPNRRLRNDGTSSERFAVLRNPTAWKPYGIISPIYWLSTGRTLLNQHL